MTEDRHADDLTEDEALDAIWEKGEAEAVNNQPRDEGGRFATKEADPAMEEKTEDPAIPSIEDEKAAEAPEVTAEAEGDKGTEGTAPEAPSHLPRAIRDVWGALDENTRAVIDSTQRDYARRLSEAETVRRSAGPVYERLVQAQREMPALSQMTPEQIAANVFELSQWANRLEQDPVGALMSIAAHRGVVDDLRQKIVGGAETAADPMRELRQELAALKSQLGQRPDPDAIKSQIEQEMLVANLGREVEAFAKSKADWGVLEPHVQARLPEMLEANPHLAPIEVLEHTYNTVANDLLHPLRSAAADEAVKARKADAARAAASLNVQPEGAGDPVPMSEDEAMDAVWAKHHN